MYYPEIPKFKSTLTENFIQNNEKLTAKFQN